MTTRKVTKYARNTNGIAQNLLIYFNKENTILSDSENPRLTVATPAIPVESYTVLCVVMRRMIRSCDRR